MADIVTNTLQIGSNNLILRDADAQAKVAVNTQDISALQEDLLSAFATDTASGAIASFPDGAAMPVKSLKVDIEPVQDLHGQANPYPAGGGKNLLHVTAVTQTSNGVTFTVNEDGTVKVNGTATANTYLYLGDSSLSALAEGSYILSGSPSGGAYASYGLQINDGSWKFDYGSGASFTKGSTLTGVAIRIANGYTANNLLFKPMIRLSSVTDATFAPYENICPISGHTQAVVTVSPTTDAQDGTSYTIDLDGTRYGGTLDVGTGVLTVDSVIKTLNGSENWLENGALFYVDYTVLNGIKNNGRIMSNAYVSTTVPDSQMTVGQMKIAGANVNFKTSFASLAAWKSELSANNVQLVYELSTPQTVQLTANEISTLLGQNNIWADTGDTEVDYRADTKLYIQKVMSS